VFIAKSKFFHKKDYSEISKLSPSAHGRPLTFFPGKAKFLHCKAKNILFDKKKQPKDTIFHKNSKKHVTNGQPKGGARGPLAPLRSPMR
jgi:hypothetical protein